MGGVIPRGQQLRLLAGATRRRGRVLRVRLPQPPGYRDAVVAPEGARWDEDLAEFVLPYELVELVRTAPDPDSALLTFLQSTYQAAADTAGWDRSALERSNRGHRHD